MRLALSALALVAAVMLRTAAAAAELATEEGLPPPSGSTYFNDPNADPDQGQPQADPGVRVSNPLFPGLALPESGRLAALRQRAYDEYGLTFGISYQQLAQWTTGTVPGAPNDTALGGWAAFSTTWTPLDRGGPYEGTLVVRLGYRNALGGNAVPAVFGLRDLGSLWSNYEFTSWAGHTRIEDLFWEQRLGRNFSFRVGNQIPTSIYNFFRFKDARTSFTGSPFAFNETIPYPTFGLGLSFRWRPLGTTSGYYVVGTLNDMNGEPAANGLDWSTFGEGQYFYGLEIGHDWRRANGEFDHLHLDVFYADRRSTRSPDTTANKAGGGFKLSGEKQIGAIVGFASYTYNTAEGGGIGATVAGQTGIAGAAYLRPFGVAGEVALGGMWYRSLNLAPGISHKDQYGIETYWNIAVTPNSSVTPGIQLIFDPALNPTSHFEAVPSIKFRVFL